MKRFGREARLLKPAHFERVFKSGRRDGGAWLTAISAPNEQAPRLGLALSRKQAPRAVDRNRLKRQIRESFRLVASQLPGCDIVVMAKPGARQRPRAEIVAELEKLWIRIAQRWSASSSL